MVTSDGIGEEVTEDFDLPHRVLGSSRGMIGAGGCVGNMRVRRRSRPQVFLKCIGVLSQVMPKPGDSRPIASVEACTVSSRTLRNILQVAE